MVLKDITQLALMEKIKMQKGDRFIWNYWVKYAKANLTESQNKFIFKGEIKAFKHLGSNILHQKDR